MKLKQFYIVFALTVFISGCQASRGGSGGGEKSKLPSSPIATMTNEENSSQMTSGQMAACERKLKALSKLSPDNFPGKEDAFMALMSNSVTYSNVRNDVDDTTRDLVDSLYKYKARKICNDVELLIQQRLIGSGESVH